MAGPSGQVVIPCRDSAATLPEQLTALARQQGAPPFAVHLVDNGSRDDTVEIAAGFRSSLELVIHRAPDVPVAVALQQAVDGSCAPWVLFLDSDDVVDDHYVRHMAAALDAHAIVAGRLDPVRLNPGELATIRPLPQAVGLMPWRGFLAWAQGCALGVRRDALEAAGGVPGDTGSSGWDVDLCWSMQERGHGLVFVPDAVVHYRFRHDLRSIWRQARRYGRSGVRRYERWRHRGMPRSPTAVQLLRWVGLLVGLPMLSSPRLRRRWLFSAGWLVGRLEESYRRRVLYL